MTAQWLKIRGCPKAVASDLHKFREERDAPRRERLTVGRPARAPSVCDEEKLQSPLGAKLVEALVLRRGAGGGGGDFVSFFHFFLQRNFIKQVKS